MLGTGGEAAHPPAHGPSLPVVSDSTKDLNQGHPSRPLQDFGYGPESIASEAFGLGTTRDRDEQLAPRLQRMEHLFEALDVVGQVLQDREAEDRRVGSLVRTPGPLVMKAGMI